MEQINIIDYPYKLQNKPDTFYITIKITDMYDYTNDNVNKILSFVLSIMNIVKKYYKIIKLNFYCYAYNNRIEEIKNYIIANIPPSTIINFELKDKNNINKKSIITSDFYTTCNSFLTLNLINYKEKILLGKCCCKPQFLLSNFDYSLFEYHTSKDLVFCNKKPEHRFRNIFKLLTVDEYNNLKDKENFSVTIPIESQIDIEKNELFFKC